LRMKYSLCYLWLFDTAEDLHIRMEFVLHSLCYLWLFDTAEDLHIRMEFVLLLFST